jgi:transcription elongation factor Elf1
MKKEDFNCKHCNKTFKARVVDRNRGWAQFCTKSCKAFHQAKIRRTLEALIMEETVDILEESVYY